MEQFCSNIDISVWDTARTVVGVTRITIYWHQIGGDDDDEDDDDGGGDDDDDDNDGGGGDDDDDDHISLFQCL